MVDYFLVPDSVYADPGLRGADHPGTHPKFFLLILGLQLPYMYGLQHSRRHVCP